MEFLIEGTELAMFVFIIVNIVRKSFPNTVQPWVILLTAFIVGQLLALAFFLITGAELTQVTGAQTFLQGLGAAVLSIGGAESYKFGRS